jgi:hypothetical protein
MPVNNERFFRLVTGMPATDTDFHSYKKLGIWPGKYSNVSECIACSISIWKDLETCLAIQKLAANKTKKVAALLLNINDGALMQTGKNQTHHSWWRTSSFIINDNITYL